MTQRFLAWLLLASACLAQDVSRMEQVVQSFVSTKRFMGTALVARGPEVLFSKAYGSANLEWNIPNTPSTKFRLGSVTKQFTAASILLLEERGKLKVDDPVKQHLPDMPAAWDKITIFNLLTHSAGIPSFTGFPEYRSRQVLATPAAKIVEWFRDKPLEFQPGEKMSYSNSGYVLLGYLIEKITGGSYEKFVQENIFEPLGMKDSGYDSNSAIIPRRASGYAPSPNGPQNAGFIHMTVPHGAGALYSTTEDLLRWEQGLFGGKVLSAASFNKMITPFKNNYAFGLIVSAGGGRKIVQHGGGIEGFNTQLSYYPDSKVTVAVLANLNGPAAGDIAGKLGALAHGETVQLPSERKEITLSPQILSQYVGTYQVEQGPKMTITLEGDRLLSKLGPQPKIPIFAESQTKFFPKVVDAQLEFLKNEKGEITDLVLHQNGRDMKFRRVSATVEEPPERKAISVSPAILKQYAGTYELRPDFEIVMTLEGDQLMTQATGQPKFPLFAESETKFFLKVVDAQVEFFKDANGAVTHLVLHQGGRDHKAPRK